MKKGATVSCPQHCIYGR